MIINKLTITAIKKCIKNPSTNSIKKYLGVSHSDISIPVIETSAKKINKDLYSVQDYMSFKRYRIYKNM